MGNAHRYVDIDEVYAYVLSAVIDAARSGKYQTTIDFTKYEYMTHDIITTIMCKLETIGYHTSKYGDSSILIEWDPHRMNALEELEEPMTTSEIFQKISEHNDRRAAVRKPVLAEGNTPKKIELLQPKPPQIHSEPILKLQPQPLPKDPAFWRFYDSQISIVQKDNPDMDVSECTSVINIKWETMDSHEKSTYWFPYYQPASVPQVPEEPDNDPNLCGVCMERPKNTLIATCNHIGYCMECLIDLKLCPTCRKPYTQNDLKKVFIV
jgi:hypothetical protein